MNGLDPVVWGDLARFGIAGEPPAELDAALDLLGRAQTMLASICDSQRVTPDAATFLHDDIAVAATHFGWWME